MDRTSRCHPGTRPFSRAPYRSLFFRRGVPCVVLLIHGCLSAAGLYPTAPEMSRAAESPSAATGRSAELSLVQFDVAPLAACHDVTTEEFARTNPNERLLEVRIEISALLRPDNEVELSEYFFRFTSPGRSLLVADYQPKTQLASQYAGNINVEQRDESSKSFGITASGVWDHLINVAGAADVASKNNRSVRYELRAPMEPVTASGTISRGTGVYFKLRPSPQTALEGSRQFSLVLRAPSGWRGDYLQVHCEAIGARRGVLRGLDEPQRVGARDFFVALYLAGHQEAKSRAEQMARSEATLQEVLISFRRELEESGGRRAIDPLKAIWRGRQPPRPSTMDRIEQLLFTHTPAVREQLPTDLPGPVGHALRAYLLARATLRDVRQ